MQELSQGTRLVERYALIKKIGEGGMAELWLAQDNRADANVVLKFLKSSLLEVAGQRELFRKEWQVASRLMHAHIARVFEYHDEDRPFYAQQFVDGPDIGDLGGQPLDSVLPAVALLADALRYTHAKDVVHRDIKASNVLFDAQGAPYLIDFGIAAASTGGSAASASPQQRAGAQPAPADDVYALGVLLHELIAGGPPGATPSLPSHSAAGDAVPPDLSGLVQAMLSEDPSARPDAETVGERLAAAGFPAGPARLPATLRAPAAVPATDDVKVAAYSRRKPSDAAPAATVDSAGGGLSARTVYGALAVLLVLLVGVTFILPSAVDRDDEPQATSEEPVVADDVEAEPSLADTPSVNAGVADDSIEAKEAADDALGDLLSVLDGLKLRGIERWGGQPYLDATNVYAEGDEAYVGKNYRRAAESYIRATDMLEPFFDRIEDVFAETMTEAWAAFNNEDPVRAVRLFDLAVAITPNDAEATAGLARARNLEAVIDLMRQGESYLDDLELDAARLAFDKALELDPLWEPAREALSAVAARITQLSFEGLMSDGFSSLAAEDFATARAAFEAAKKIFPDSREPGDGLLQTDQEERLYRIRVMEREAVEQEANEEWESAVTTYEALLDVDGDLAFAQEGLYRSRQRAALHRQLQAYVDDPDGLSDPANMQNATQLLLSVSTMPEVGPRLEDHKNVLARLLKRAATPLVVEFVSDGVTDVTVYKVGKLGSFSRQQLELRPGTYVAVGIRRGFRDVRQEFRVAPEIDMQPVVVQCEEPI